MRTHWFVIGAAILLAGLSVGLIYAQDHVVLPVIEAKEAEQLEAKQLSEPDNLPASHADQIFDSSLPLVAIETDGQDIPYGTTIECQIYLYDSEDGSNNIQDLPSQKIRTLIHYRGQSSAFFSKRQYSLEFYKQNKEKKEDLSVFGMAEGHDWVLNGPYFDKSLIRNYFCYGLARDIMFYAPDVRYCEAYLNGEYIGVYLMLEKPRIHENRINFSDSALSSGQTAYMVQRNRPWEMRSYTLIEGERERTPGPSGIDTSMDWLNTFGLQSGNALVPLFVEYPTSDRITQQEYDYIVNDISSVERALYADWFLDPERGYKTMIDLTSFVDYYLIMEFAMNKDNGFYSTYMCKDIDGKLMMGPGWDYNSAFGNYLSSEMSPEGGFVIADNNWYSRMMKDPSFTEAVIERWHALRQGIFSEENLLERLEEASGQLTEASIRNEARWSSAYAKNMRSADQEQEHTYAEAIEKVRDFIIRRGDYMDENIEKLRLLSTE